MSNPQKVYDNYKATYEGEVAADKQFGAALEGPQAKIHQAQENFEATAKRTWPAKFKAVEDSWRALGADFKPQSLLSERQVVARNFDNVAKKEADLSKAVLSDGLDFYNHTKTQRAAWKGDVETYMKENERINQQFGEAWDYEMDNMEFSDDSDGDVEFEIHHQKEILSKWRNASVDDTLAKKKLIREFKKYQASIAA